jgi:hypothetical protein
MVNPPFISVSNDFVLGVGCCLGAWVLSKVYQAFQSPSLASIEKNCTQPLPHMGDDGIITVWGFEEGETHPLYGQGITDDSPYVMRVEYYLKLIKEPYVKAESKGTMENPRGKVPFANIKGIMVDDSSAIITTLQNTCAINPDQDLTDDEKATGHLIRQLLFGSLYWVLLHQNFETDTGRQCFSAYMANKMPPVISHAISALVFRNMHACLHGSGVGRMSHADIVKKGQADVRALSQILGKRKFFVQDKKPTSIDTDVFAWLNLLFSAKPQVSQSWVQDIQEECPNLVQHTERMRQLLFPK